MHILTAPTPAVLDMLQLFYGTGTVDKLVLPVSCRGTHQIAILGIVL